MKNLLIIAIMISVLFAIRPAETLADYASVQISISTNGIWIENGQAVHSPYIYGIGITGYNQNNTRVCYPSCRSGDYLWLPHWSRTSVSVSNWWWQKGKSVFIEFYLDGYGYRTCNFGIPSNTSGQWITAYYIGNNQCSTIPRGAGAP